MIKINIITRVCAVNLLALWSLRSFSGWRWWCCSLRSQTPKMLHIGPDCHVEENLASKITADQMKRRVCLSQAVLWKPAPKPHGKLSPRLQEGTRNQRRGFFGATTQKPGSGFGSEGIHMLPGLKSILERYLVPRLQDAPALRESIEPKEAGGGEFWGGWGDNLKREEWFGDEWRRAGEEEGGGKWD